ncbi:filamentous hemagglutinin N-terminal domain-containing protein [Falsiroseomonas sp. CW058]|uniref:two-partner secretion domain-containing protein n=1 Tax=Falsiroseomonas sp. CW058 TaxID=3388664 RepID=UPI003D31C691
MRRHLRPLLLATTALLAPGLALAQSPQGGRVVAGQAAIAQTPGRTQVTQGSDRAVIEWRQFDVGAGHQVDIRQPATSSFSLQRVTGPDPSAIAGRVTSNGGVALVNPAGIVFHQGAQVDVAGLIATTADIPNTAFMAGRMAFDGPSRPGARVENRGGITVAEGGMAALVAPHVVNSGTIRARLGRVALAGGEAFALDLAGDGLLSLDVTRQVAAAPGGGAALVTNTGTIDVAGGHVTLTARAASGLLESLVEAGGRIAAPGGTVEATAPGGAVRVPAGALLDTAGGAGGGRITVGAGRDSSPGAPQRLSATTTVARDATLRAGRGGTVIVHAGTRTTMSGTVEAEGGTIEVSSRGALALDGAMRAPGGTVLVDPQELRIVATLSGTAEPAEVTAATVNATTGALVLQADRSIRVLAAVNKPVGPLTLQTTNATAAAGDGIRIERPLRVTGDLALLSAGDITQSSSGAAVNAGTLAARSTGGAVRLDAGGNAIRALAGGGAATRFDLATTTALSVDGAVAAPALRIASNQRLSLFAPVEASGVAELVGLRGIVQAAGGAGVSAGTLLLESPLGAVALGGAGNRIVNLGDGSAPLGLVLVNETALNLAGTLSAGAVMLTARGGDLTQDPAASRLLASEFAAFAPAGSVLFDGPLNAIPRLRGAARDAFVVDAGGALALSGGVAAAEVWLRAAGDITQEPGAAIATGLLRADAAGGSAVLDDPANAVLALGDAGAALAFTLATATPLAIRGTLAAPEVTLVAAGIAQGDAGAIATALLRANARAGDVALTGAGHAIAALGPGGAAGGFAVATGGALAVTGALDAGGTLALEAASLRLAADLVGRDVRLVARGGDVAQEAGRIAAATLRAEAAGAVRLEAAGNALAAAGGRAGTAFRLRSSGTLAADGIAAEEVALAAGGAVHQPDDGAGIAAGLLSVRAGGAVTLAAPANTIAALGQVAAPGGLDLRSGRALLLTQPLDLPSARLVAGGTLAQAEGAPLSAGLLRATAAGDILFEAPGNAIARLGGTTAEGALRLATTGALVLEGTQRAGSVLALTAGGTLRQGAGGVLDAPRLHAVSLGGDVDLGGANRVAALSGSAAGRWAFAAPGGGALALAGVVAAPEVAIAAGGDLGEGVGALRTGLLTLDVAGGVALGGAGHRVAALAGRAGALRLAAGGPLQVTGPLASGAGLELAAESIGLLAPVGAAGGALLVATAGDVAQAPAGAALRLGAGLEVHAAGAVALDGAGNAVPVLLGGSATGGFALATEGALALRGALSGETVALRAGAGLLLDGAVLGAGRAVLLAAPGGLSGGAPSRVLALDPGRHPVLLVDTRRIGGLRAIPDAVRADLPGLAPAQQATQLATFGPAGGAEGAGAVFDIAAGASPVFLLLGSGAALGVLEAGRLGVLGQGGSAFVVGTLGGAGGEAAAALVAVAAAAPGYLFNQCGMGLAGCGAPPPPPAEPPRVPPPAIVVPPPAATAIVVPPPAPAPAAPAPGFHPTLQRAFGEAALAPAPWFPWPPRWPLDGVARVEE